MSEIMRYLYDKSGYMFLNSHGDWVRYEDNQAEIGRLTAERDAAQAEVERLRANGQVMPDSSRPTDEDIWREAFMVLLRKTSYAWERTSEEADRVLAVYRKRWPR